MLLKSEKCLDAIIFSAYNKTEPAQSAGSVSKDLIDAGYLASFPNIF